jgi:hypothetical protein
VTISIHSVKRILFQRFETHGNLTVFESAENSVPFEIRRAFAITDAPAGVSRADHAHRKCSQLLVCLGGAVSVKLLDGEHQTIETLSNDGLGILVPPMIWNSVRFESAGTVLLVYCDQHYEDDEYIRDWDAFLSEKRFLTTE